MFNFNKGKMSWADAQVAEANSWLISDPRERREKLERELARYPKLRKDMGLDLIDTSDKFVLEIGGGPVGVIYDLVASKKAILDPLTDEFKRVYPCPYHVKGTGEAIPFNVGSVDVVVISNTLDHCQTPEVVLWEAKRVLRAGGWLAICNCIDLASIHRHPAHLLNLDEQWFHNIIDEDFETVHELNWRKDKYRYGWVRNPWDNKTGEPAWAGLYRKVTGYKGGEI